MEGISGKPEALFSYFLPTSKDPLYLLDIVGCHGYRWSKNCPDLLSQYIFKNLPVEALSALRTSHLLEWPSSKRQEVISVSEGVAKREASYTVGENVNWCSHYGKQCGGSSEN